MRLSSVELRVRATEACERYRDCQLCAHRCRVDRTRGPAGKCSEGDSVYLAGAGVHFGEEPQLTGPGGSGLVLIAGCNLACRACETADFSLQRRGITEVDEAQLAALFLDLQRRGATNLNLVTPTHVLPALLCGLARASEHGFSLPVVWNCGGYETREALLLLDGVVDIYLPDAKYGTAAAGLAYSGCADYPGALAESLAEMHRQVGVLAMGPDGLAQKGVLVRHLVLPGGVAGPREVMSLVAGISLDTWVNVMSQYRPLHEAAKLPVIDRVVSKDEVARTVAAARDAGLHNLLVDGRSMLCQGASQWSR